MDAPEADLDIKLQKISGDLIADLDRSLVACFRKPGGNGGAHGRSFVKARETFDSTTAVLDLFQELPQLLDPQLPKWIPYLAHLYLEYSQTRRRAKKSKSSNSSGLLVPADYAICKILYAFCKVRGEKVIVRFLNAEARYLELLLSAMEEAEGKSKQDAPSAWEWEQRYVVLLWLSHLLLAPFDLSTISTLETEESDAAVIKGFEWPSNLPSITKRIVPLALKYLSSPGKERDAAKALLVRVAMRRDMQQSGVLDALVRWSLGSLRHGKDEPPLQAVYFYLGVLSFLAGVLGSAAETSDMNQYHAPIFYCIHDLTLGNNDLSRSIIKLAIVRKVILKIIRCVAVSLLRQSQQSMANTDMVETAVGYLLDSVSDNDTPVRLSASKALSVITLKLDPGMAAQVVEAVLESLNKNVLWTRPSDSGKETRPVRNLSSVNNLEWHGLILTLAHLLYRRSPPAKQLSDIIHALLLGLSFEQRSMSGASVGSNIRDAACFGIWALARRYTTQELLDVSTTSVFAATTHPASSTILQVLGTELVVTASLDPSGNIRRGASAALQELIGRHPDAVERGIEVVQVVDYHAVARRSRAVEEVAVKAAELSIQYGTALIEGILGWRGIGEVDAQSRRVAAQALGALVAERAAAEGVDVLSSLTHSVDLVMKRITLLAKRQVEERHGLLLCLASVVDRIGASIQHSREPSEAEPLLIRKLVAFVSDALEDCRVTEYRKPELVAEGVSRLVVSSMPILQLAVFDQRAELTPLQTGQHSSSPAQPKSFLTATSQRRVSPSNLSRYNVDGLLTSLREVIPSWLSRNEPETVQLSSTAAIALAVFSTSQDRETMLQGWATTVGAKPTSRALTTGKGYFHALAMAQPVAAEQDHGADERDVASQALLSRWGKDDNVDTRVTILQSLIRSSLLQAHTDRFLSLLVEGLNDYTTNARGDVGSHVRVQALRAVRSLFASPTRPERLQSAIKKLIPSILRLSAEKLDRVRLEAQAVVGAMMKAGDAERFRTLTLSSTEYFEALLGLVASGSSSRTVLGFQEGDEDEWMGELMAGFVTSADTGNDDLVVASRTALTRFCESSREHLELVCASLVQNLRTRRADDRVAVPTLEIIAFLFHVGLLQASESTDLADLCECTRRAGYKTGSVRKLVACVKVYGAIATTTRVEQARGAEAGRAGRQQARKRLGALLSHPWPRVRSAVVDEMWGLSGFGEEGDAQLTSVDWSAAGKEQIRATVYALGME
ncbi:uncharacterized protein UV8b_01102 [Ustilaginoidea virens]|uniref:Beta-tubulin cofactor d n=1 Tax=Ustilaginoidea virens TaxID=1159556 RepID=A0A8E5ME13_USTVR|nr:uncharacterized protein UV8b_01102 [Ustilaginoidea virens]QUC16861.1 hypothetical protein UV8b_01102 [Ustilaginoidea virens]